MRPTLAIALTTFALTACGGGGGAEPTALADPVKPIPNAGQTPKPAAPVVQQESDEPVGAPERPQEPSRPVEVPVQEDEPAPVVPEQPVVPEPVVDDTPTVVEEEAPAPTPAPAPVDPAPITAPEVAQDGITVPYSFPYPSSLTDGDPEYRPTDDQLARGLEYEIEYGDEGNSLLITYIWVDLYNFTGYYLYDSYCFVDGHFDPTLTNQVTVSTFVESGLIELQDQDQIRVAPFKFISGGLDFQGQVNGIDIECFGETFDGTLIDATGI